MIVSLPWPDPRLSPNARVHWRRKVGPKQSAKIAAGWAAVAAPGYHSARDALRATQTPIPITIRFIPPDRRHRDADNMLASCKAQLDGIADAIGINDNRFRPQLEYGEPEKPGRVEVSIAIPRFEHGGDGKAIPCLVNGDRPFSGGDQ